MGIRAAVVASLLGAAVASACGPGESCRPGVRCRTFDVVSWCWTSAGACVLENVGCYPQAESCTTLYFPVLESYVGFQPVQRLSIDLSTLPAETEGLSRVIIVFSAGAPVHAETISISFDGATPQCDVQSSPYYAVGFDCERPHGLKSVEITRTGGPPGSVAEADQVSVTLSQSVCTERIEVCGV